MFVSKLTVVVFENSDRDRTLEMQPVLRHGHNRQLAIIATNGCCRVVILYAYCISQVSDPSLESAR